MDIKIPSIKEAELLNIDQKHRRDLAVNLLKRIYAGQHVFYNYCDILEILVQFINDDTITEIVNRLELDYYHQRQAAGKSRKNMSAGLINPYFLDNNALENCCDDCKKVNKLN